MATAKRKPTIKVNADSAKEAARPTAAETPHTKPGRRKAPSQAESIETGSPKVRPSPQTPAAAKPRRKSAAPVATATPREPDTMDLSVGSPACATSQRAQPSYQQIADRAYQIYQSRGGIHGRHEQDWHQAERELTSLG